MHVLFVCTANVCRSPAAEYYLRHVAARLGLADLASSSAGMLDFGGCPADPGIARLLAERGIDVSAHRARAATPGLLRAADLVVCMERRHRAFVLDLCPDLEGRVVLLREGEAPLRDADVPDPTGGGDADYRDAAGLIFRAVERLALARRYPAP